MLEFAGGSLQGSDLLMLGSCLRQGALRLMQVWQRQSERHRVERVWARVPETVECVRKQATEKQPKLPVKHVAKFLASSLAILQLAMLQQHPLAATATPGFLAQVWQVCSAGFLLVATFCGRFLRRRRDKQNGVESGPHI